MIFCCGDCRALVVWLDCAVARGLREEENKSATRVTAATVEWIKARRPNGEGRPLSGSLMRATSEEILVYFIKAKAIKILRTETPRLRGNMYLAQFTQPWASVKCFRHEKPCEFLAASPSSGFHLR